MQNCNTRGWICTNCVFSGSTFCGISIWKVGVGKALPYYPQAITTKETIHSQISLQNDLKADERRKMPKKEYAQKGISMKLTWFSSLSLSRGKKAPMVACPGLTCDRGMCINRGSFLKISSTNKLATFIRFFPIRIHCMSMLIRI